MGYGFSAMDSQGIICTDKCVILNTFPEKVTIFY